ncbi:DUF2264 domain-containing protein [Streptomyces drozdowiczii]|uniref:DUF2264 domain-containing protein n=1 Tax=Streptomyces drozdowiczii TaxID=202862 RepID=UPI0031EDED8C
MTLLPDAPSALSPYTGWERHHWAAYADRLLAALDPYRSPAGARILLPGPNSSYGPDSDGLEGFARTFLLAGFRIAGERGKDPGGLLERYADGLAAGTDPNHPEAWPRPDELGQAKVEAASVALILQLTRPWLWDRLDSGVRERTVAWLATVIGQSYPPINWVWFRIVVESFLREAGGPWSAADIEEDLAVHASLRRADGWLSDGQERAFDHYTGWALHTYPLLWTALFDVTGTLCPPALRREWEDDLGRYLDDAVRLTGADGSPLMQGRSLIYRFAAAAPLWTGAFTGASRLSPGLTRRAASGVLDHFARRGVPDDDGLLTMGWHKPWPAMRQSYSGPGSPYWASKGMLGLALPADHPVWTAAEEPLPVEREPQARVVAAPGWLVSARPEDGIVTVLNHGTDHAHPGTVSTDALLYARLGYSTATVPPLTGPTVDDPVDNTVALLDAEGRASHRTGFEPSYATELPHGVLAAVSTGAVHWVDVAEEPDHDHGSGRTGTSVRGPRVTVASVVRDGTEVRLVRVDGPPGRAVRVRLGGWPLAGDRRPETEAGEDTVRVTVTAGDLTSELRGLTEMAAAGRTGGEEGGVVGFEETGRTGCQEAGVVGFEEAGRTGFGQARVAGFEEAGVTVERGTSPLGDWTAVPWLAAPVPGPGAVLAARVVLTRGTAAAWGAATVSAYGGGVVVRWGDGVESVVPLV